MATTEKLGQIKKSLEAITSLNADSLIARADWGSIRFDDAQPSITRILAIAGDLSLLPLELLDDDVLNNLTDQLNRAHDVLKQIDQFSLANGNPNESRNNLVNAVRDRGRDLLNTSFNWTAYLGFKKGDVQSNIKALTGAVATARRGVDEDVTHIGAKKKEIDEIVVAAREASASAGVAHFTVDFATQATSLESSANRWLIVTGVLALATLAFAIAAFFHAVYVEPKSQIQFMQFTLAKALTFAVLLTAVIWCGRIYKALTHQASINRHRATAIKTFQAFNKAASDDTTRNAVLLETTRAIFALTPSGLIDSGSEQSDASTKVVEILRGGRSKGG